MEISVLTEFYEQTTAPLQITARVKDDNCLKLQNAPGRHFHRLSTNGTFPFLEKLEMLLTSKDVTGNSLFFKDVCNPSIFLGPHPLFRQVSRFPLGSSSLAILSARSMIE